MVKKFNRIRLHFKNFSSNEIKILFPIFILAFFLRIIHLGLRDFWFDEAFTYHLASLPLKDLLPAVLSDNNPPLYYLLIHFVLYLGKEEAILRTPSMIFNLLTIVIVYKTAAKIFNNRLAIISSLLMAVSPLAIYFSTEARLHSMGMFFISLIIYFFILLLRKPDYKNKIFFTITLTLGLYSQYYIALIVIPITLILFIKHKFKVFKSTALVSLFSLVPWIIFSGFVQHNGCACPNSIISLPATLVSPILGGVGEFSLRYFPNLPREIIALYTFVAIFGTLLFIKGLFKNSISIYYFIPLIIIAIIGLFLPVFSPKGFSIFLPVYILVTSLGINSLRKANYIFTILFIGMLAVSLSQVLIVDFKGYELRKIFELTKSDPTIPTYHASAFTYYSFRYYSGRNSDQKLLTNNPLSQDTVRYIGGQKVDPENLKNKFWLVDTSIWVNPKDYESLSEMIKSYNIIKEFNYPNIDLRLLILPPPRR